MSSPWAANMASTSGVAAAPAVEVHEARTRRLLGRAVGQDGPDLGRVHLGQSGEHDHPATGVADAVAEAHHDQAAGAGHGQDVHGHGVGVVQQQGLRGELLHLADHLQQHRQRAEGAEYPAYAQGVAYHLPQAELRRDLYVLAGGLEAAHADGVDDVVGPVDGSPTVGGGDDPRPCLPGAIDGLGHGADHLQSLPVDVHQGEGRLFEGIEGEDVRR